MNPSKKVAVGCQTTTATAGVALCVDLDGTLVKCDTLVDGLLTLVRRKPLAALRCFLFVTQGRAAFKAEVARHVILNPATLPYNRPLLNYLETEHAAGRGIYLATAANEQQARRVADHLGIFAGVFGSGADTNLAGGAKREILNQQFPGRGFDYIGNATADIPVLSRANKAMLANPTLGVAGPIKKQNIKIHRVFDDRAPRFGTFVKAIRVQQWPKNLLIFLPVILAHMLFHLDKFVVALVAFVSWSLAASAAYILNDLLDVDADRSHPAKRRRPFAAGDLSAEAGIATALLLLAGSILIAVRVPFYFSAWLALYFATSLAYSFVLKRLALVDVITLAGLYTVRMAAGASATNVAFSPWLGGFSIFFFLSLAMVKRTAELNNLRKSGEIPSNDRGYRVEDIEQLRSFGTASGYASVVVFSLYINNSDIIQLYSHYLRLWLLTPVLILWINRIWLLAHRGELEEDPVIFALTDSWSAILGMLAAVIVLSSV